MTHNHKRLAALVEAERKVKKMSRLKKAGATGAELAAITAASTVAAGLWSNPDDAIGAVAALSPTAQTAAVIMLGLYAALQSVLRHTRKPTDREPRIKLPPRRPPAAPLAMAVLALLLFTACAFTHPLLQPGSVAAVLKVATPYVMNDCAEVKLYGGYALDFEGEATNDYKHGFSVIAGGCGKYALLTCWATDCDPKTDAQCPGAINCLQIGTLIDSKAQATAVLPINPGGLLTAATPL